MTENEAKRWLEYIGNMNLPYDRSPKSRKLACNIAIQALEEIQQYRAIGTVEEFKALKENELKCEDCAGCTNWKCDCANVRANAIDEFAERLKRNSRLGYIGYLDEVVDEIAEQLKGGGTDA